MVIVSPEDSGMLDFVWSTRQRDSPHPDDLFVHRDQRAFGLESVQKENEVKVLGLGSVLSHSIFAPQLLGLFP